jgi:hypothetical protein
MPKKQTKHRAKWVGVIDLISLEILFRGIFNIPDPEPIVREKIKDKEIEVTYANDRHVSVAWRRYFDTGLRKKLIRLKKPFIIDKNYG